MKRTTEVTTNETQARKAKTYYPIHRTPVAARAFKKAFYDDVKPSIPAIVKQIEQTADASNRKQITDILIAELTKMEGSCKSTLNYASNHATDGLCPLADDTELLEELRMMKSEITDAIETVQRIKDYSKTSSIFANLANGIIPSGYTAAPSTEAPEDAEPPSPSLNTDSVSH